jgi:hypothetical protein
VNSDDAQGDDVWLRLYLAVISWILVGVGLFSVIGFSPGGLLTRAWSPAPLVLGCIGLLAAAVGRSVARVFLVGLGACFVIVGIALGVELWPLLGAGDFPTVGVLAMVATGAAGMWLAWGRYRQNPAGGAMPEGVPATSDGRSTERWWQTRWWLALVALGFPFVFGISAAFAAAVTSSPAATGCGLPGEKLLRAQASALAERIPGLTLGSLSGCDSGDPAWIEWQHHSLPRLVTSAKAAGCRDAYLDEWDEQVEFMVCDIGAAPLFLDINIDPDADDVTGSISLGD